VPFANPSAVLRPAVLGVARVLRDQSLCPVDRQPNDGDGIENNKYGGYKPSHRSDGLKFTTKLLYEERCLKVTSSFSVVAPIRSDLLQGFTRHGRLGARFNF
jgi:hypothetical protein